MARSLTDDTTTAIDQLVYDWLADTDAPGASLVIVDPDGERYATGFGSRNLATNDPVTPDTLYGFASVTKSVTALAVLQQVEAGRIDLTDSIAAHTDAAFDGADEIEIRSLLTHTSGLPSLGTSAVLIARLADMGETGLPLGDHGDLMHLVNRAGAERDEVTAGRFMYNNTAYILLSKAVANAAGEPFPEYVERAILDPLGMERSTFDAERFAEDSDHATPYRPSENGMEQTTFPSRDLSHGPGGLISSPRELGRYLRCQLADGEFNGTQLVDSSLLAEAHQAHVEPLPRYGDGYGYGWSTRETAGVEIVGHGGSLLTSSAAIGFAPALNLGVALGCAGQPELHPTSILEGIVAILADADPTTVPELAYRERVNHLTGEYTSYRGIATATVSDAGGYLEVKTQSGSIEGEQVLVPEDPTLDSFAFSALGPGRTTPAEFVETDDGIDLLLDRYRFHKAT